MRRISTRLSFFLPLFAVLACAAQIKINPNSQINWPLASGAGAPSAACSSANYGQPYTDTATGVYYVCSATGWAALTTGIGFPLSVGNGGTGASTASAALANLGGFPISSLPVSIANGGTGATTAQQAAANIVNGNAIAPSSINSIILADQYPVTGTADICTRINAAAKAALAAGISYVDATHFTGTQSCSVNMLGNIAAWSNSVVPLTVTLGAVTINSSVAQTITNPGIRLKGMGPMLTRIAYVGTTLIPAVLTVGPPSPSSIETNTMDEVSGIAIYGGLSNATDGLLILATHHSQFNSITTWGVTSCGIHTEYAVTDKFDYDRTSKFDAAALSINSSSYSTPSSEFCFDELSSGLTTSDSTVNDAAAEGLTGIGWNLIAAQNMTFVSGTSESNLQGANVANGDIVNTFIGVDFESNSSGNDLTDNGQFTKIDNTLMSSTGANSNLILGATSNFAYIIGGSIATTTYAAGSRGYTICESGACTFPGQILTYGNIQGYAVHSLNYIAAGSSSRTGSTGDLLYGLSANGAIHSDSNWGMLLKADTTSPAVADYYFMNSAGVGRMIVDKLGTFGVGSNTVAASDPFNVTSTGAESAVSLSLSSDSQFTANPRSLLPFATGQLAGITTGSMYFVGQLVKNATIENFTGTAGAFTCTTNPTLTLEDCGTTAGTCSSPTALASVTLTAANTITAGTVSSSTLTAGHYFTVETTAGACTILNATGSAEYKMQ